MTESTKMICKGCDNDTFTDEEDGSVYCKQCYTQVEDIIQTGDGEIGYYRRKDTRRRHPLKPNSDTINPSDQDYYKETRDRYVKGHLMMITYQCDTLVEKFNVTPLIIGLVGPISLRFVSLSGVFDDDWANKVIHNSKFQPQETKEHEKLNGKRAVKIWLILLKKSLPLSSYLVTSFLACHKAGTCVLPSDIVRWARQGKIPYLSCFRKIRKQMGERSSSTVCSVPPVSIMFRPFQIVSAQRLEAQAALIADVIGLPLPPVNFYGIASNYLQRLSIREDNAVLDLVCLIKNWSLSSDLYLSKNELRLPTRVCVMSVVIVAVRMLYKINGFGVWERSLGLVNVSELSDVMKDTEFDTEDLLKNLERRYYEIIAETFEYEKGIFSYLSHGRNEIFASLEEASADDTYKTLWNIYPKDKEFERFETSSKRGRYWEDDYLSLNQLTLSNGELMDGINPCSSHSRNSETASMDCDEPSMECVSSNQEEISKERAKRRLITDMEEHLFCYIQPRVKVKRLDYLKYVRKRKDGELIYAAHADYYILLRVCAMIAEIDVRTMHRAVLNFERRLSWIEKRIDHVLHLTPPFIFSRDTKTSTS